MTYEEWKMFNPEGTQEQYDAYVAEENRKIDFANRLKAIKDLRLAVMKVDADRTENKLGQPNLALLEKSIINENRLEDLLALESKVPEIEAQILEVEAAELAKKQAKDRVKALSDNDVRMMAVPELNNVIADIKMALGL